MVASVTSTINVTYPTSSSGWYEGDVNIFSWTNASYSSDQAALNNYTIPNPFSFNFSVIPTRCEGSCPTYSADYGPFVGTNGSAQLDLSSKAQSGQYYLQVYFFDAARDTVVVIGDSDNFTIAAPQGNPLKPFEEDNSAKRSTTVLSFGSVLALLLIAALAL